ncbi:kinetochore protein NDC80 homolog [Prorops nasuta]|uniref:kinetochore protein NDC80 homolog n=1 Tax=Prorops nasuta TaxID=863751 RepID=UPI0034CD08BB
MKRQGSTDRRSSTNPVRISMFDREDRVETRRTTIVKPKGSLSNPEATHIPRPRVRSTSNIDQSNNNRKSNLLQSGKTPLRQIPRTPVTPRGSYRSNVGINTISNSVRFNSELPARSPSAERANNLRIKGSRKDIRPLTDKAYQADTLRMIDEYFYTIQQSGMLNSNHSLKPITLKMFVEVSDLLLKLLGIKQTITIANYIEELPKIAVKLSYSGVMAKSWLKTANAMHSWPNVLGWIGWLVELNQIKEVADEKFKLENLPFIEEDEEQVKLKKHILFSMFQFYKAWNDEKPDADILVEQFLEEIDKEYSVDDKEVEIAQIDLQESKESFQVIRNKYDNICKKSKQMDDIQKLLENDKLKLLKNIEEKKEYIEYLKSGTQQINMECKSLTEQIHQLKLEHEELKTILKNQPMSPTERDEILAQCDSIHNYDKEFYKHLEEMNKEVYSLDIKLSSVNNNLSKAILAYNKDIFMYLSEANINVDQLKMPEKEFANPDTMDILHSKANLMTQYKNEFLKQLCEIEQLIERGSDDIEDLNERIKFFHERDEDKAAKLAKEKDLAHTIKTQAKEEESKIRDQIKNLENEIKKIEEAMPNVQSVVRELNETKEKLNAVNRKKATYEQNVSKFLSKFYQIIGSHRKAVVQSLLQKQGKKIHN